MSTKVKIGLVSTGNSQNGLRDQSYSTRISEILAASPNPENFTTYTETALGSVVSLLGDAATDLVESNPNIIRGLSAQELEDEAARYAGIQDVPTILDHISNIAQSLSKVDAIATGIITTDSDLPLHVPPGPLKTLTVRGGDSHRQPTARMDRFRMVLLVLQQEFGIDLTNPQQLSIQPGIVGEGQFRKEPYHLISAPELGRSILVCDEAQNVTYILDNKKMPNNLTPGGLAQLTKDELDHLLAEHPGFGKRIVYSKNYVTRVADLLKRDSSFGPDKGGGAKGSTLLGEASSPAKGEVSLRQFSLKHGLSAGSLSVRLAELQKSDDSLSGGVVIRDSGNGQDVQYLTPNQQQALLSQLDIAARINAAPIAEGEISRKELVEQYQVSNTILGKLLEELKIAYPNVFNKPEYRLLSGPRSKKIQVFTAQQLEVIETSSKAISWLERRDLPLAENGELSVTKIATGLRARKDRVKAAIVKHNGENPDSPIEPTRMKVVGSNKPAEVYSLEDQEIIKALLKK